MMPGVEPICQGIPLPIGMTNTQRWLRPWGGFDRLKIAEEIISKASRW